MVSGMMNLVLPLLVYGDEQLLSSGEMIAIGVGAGLVALAVIIAIVIRMNRRSSNPQVESCPQCGSMSVQHRGGLAVCMDCGHSVKTQEAEA